MVVTRREHENTLRQCGLRSTSTVPLAWQILPWTEDRGRYKARPVQSSIGWNTTMAADAWGRASPVISCSGPCLPLRCDSLSGPGALPPCQA
jgi:hypothetical protein